MTKFERGDYVLDTEANHEKKLVVVSVPGATADEWIAYETEDGEVTVADDNPNYPSDSPVVLASFLNDDKNEKSLAEIDRWGKANDLFKLVCDSGIAFYAFPEGRLKPTSSSTINNVSAHNDHSHQKPLDERIDELTEKETDGEGSIITRLQQIIFGK